MTMYAVSCWKDLADNSANSYEIFEYSWELTHDFDQMNQFERKLYVIHEKD